MTARALLHHLFPWEIAPGIARDDQPRHEAESAQAAPVALRPAA